MTPEIEQLKGELANLEARISMAEAQIAVIDDDIPEPEQKSAESGSAGLDVAGTPALFKVVQLLGWQKAAAESDWEQMSISAMVADPPGSLWPEYDTSVGESTYPWYSLRPTWDYVRAH